MLGLNFDYTRFLVVCPVKEGRELSPFLHPPTPTPSPNSEVKNLKLLFWLFYEMNDPSVLIDYYLTFKVAMVTENGLKNRLK